VLPPARHDRAVGLGRRGFGGCRGGLLPLALP
jgi:hypothetical protein